MQAFDGVTTALELESEILPVAAWYDHQGEAGRVSLLRRKVRYRGASWASFGCKTASTMAP